MTEFESNIGFQKGEAETVLEEALGKPKYYMLAGTQDELNRRLTEERFGSHQFVAAEELSDLREQLAFRDRQLTAQRLENTRLRNDLLDSTDLEHKKSLVDENNRLRAEKTQLMQTVRNLQDRLEELFADIDDREATDLRPSQVAALIKALQ